MITLDLILKSFLLGLALCVDSLVVSTTSAFKTRLSYRRGFLLAVIFGLFQGGFPLIGALIGDVCERFISSVDHWVAFGLLLLVGGKMIIDAFKDEANDTVLDLSRIWVICTLAIATSIDAFVVGIGFGIDNSNSPLQSFFTCIIIALVTFLVSFIGVFLGKRNIPIHEKWATIIAGTVLIGLGIHTLLEHLIGF